MFIIGQRFSGVHELTMEDALLCRAINHVMLQHSDLPFNPTVRASALRVNYEILAWPTLLCRQFWQKRGEQRLQMGRSK